MNINTNSLNIEDNMSRASILTSVEIKGQDRKKSAEYNFMCKELNEDWLAGKTCSEVFSELTRKERKALKDYYITNDYTRTTELKVKEILKKLDLNKIEQGD